MRPTVSKQSSDGPIVITLRLITSSTRMIILLTGHQPMSILPSRWCNGGAIGSPSALRRLCARMRLVRRHHRAERGAPAPRLGRPAPLGPRAILRPMSAKEMVAFLTQSPAFAGLPTREIEALARVALEERHRARSTVFMEGDPARWFYLVKTGHVKIVRHSKTGKDVVLELLG